MAVAVPGKEHDIVLGDLAEDQRRRRLSVGRADDLAVGNGERGQAGEPAATDDGEHGMDGFRKLAAVACRSLPENPALDAAQLLLCSTLVILVNS